MVGSYDVECAHIMMVSGVLRPQCTQTIPVEQSVVKRIRLAEKPACNHETDTCDGQPDAEVLSERNLDTLLHGTFRHDEVGHARKQRGIAG